MPAVAEPVPALPAPPPPAGAPRGPAGRRAARVAERAGTGALVLGPAALTAWLAFRSGGYFAGHTAVAALVVLGLIAARLALARGSLPGLGALLAVLVALFGGFTAWTAASAGWSGAEARSLIDYDRALLYLGVLVLFGSLAWTPGRLRWAVRALAAAALAVCAAGVLTQLLPGTFEIDATSRSERLRHPVSFWNSMGLMAALGGLLLGHLACDPREWPWVRVAATAGLPVCALALVLTGSRGATVTVILGALVYVALARPRLAPLTALAGLPAAALAVKGVWGEQLVPGGSDSAAWLLAAAVAGAALLRAALLPVDARLLRVRLPAVPSRAARAGLALAAVAVVAAGSLALGAPGAASDAWRSFQQEGTLSDGSGRITSLGNNGRIDLWEVALDQHASAPLRGTGAGTFGFFWTQRLEGSGRAYDAHSLYLETLGELGWAGLGLLAAFLLVALAAALRRARGPDRALGAVVAAAMVAWAAAVAVDWHWEIPAVTAWLFALAGMVAAAPRASAAATPRDAARRRGRLALRAGAVVAGAGLCALLAGLPLDLARSQAHLDRAVRALEAGDCRTSEAAAVRAARAMPARPQPFEVIAYCEARARRFALATAAIAEALEREPLDARLHINAGLITAAGGGDPRPALRRARRLAPRELASRDLLGTLRSEPRRRWPQIARTTPLVLE